MSSKRKAAKRKASDILLQSALTLTKKEWKKGDFFRSWLLNGEIILCRCAHGQIKWCGQEEGFQEEVRNMVAKNGLWFGPEVMEDVAVSAVRLGKSKDGTYNDRNLQQWLDYQQSCYPDTFNRSLFLAHYYAAKVGLTFKFNDAPRTTYKQVIAKLHKASVLAASEGN
jgi:hypothetical protein